MIVVVGMPSYMVRSSGARDIIEAVQAIGDVLNPTGPRQLAQLHRRDPQVGGVLCGDETVLVESTSEQSPAICFNEHLALLYVTRVLKTVRLGQFLFT